MRLSLPVLLLAALTVAACDSTPTGADAFVGTWDHAYSDFDVTVISTIDQTYRTYDVAAPDGIDISGIWTARLRYSSFPFHGHTTTSGSLSLRDFCPNVLSCTSDDEARLSISEGNLAVSFGPQRETVYSIEDPTIQVSIDDTIATIPEVTVQTPDGELRIGGTLTIFETELAAGVATLLPTKRTVSSEIRAFTLERDGTVRWGSGANAVTGTWEADGSEIRLIRDSDGYTQRFTYARDGDRLVFTQEAPTADPNAIALMRGLESGSIDAYSMNSTWVYEPLR